MKVLYYIKKFVIIICVFCMCGILSNCKKFVEIPMPTDQLTSESIFNNDKTATQAIAGIYTEMIKGLTLFSAGQTTFLAGMCADELYNYTSGFEDAYAKNELTANPETNIESLFWNPCYRFIYAANKCIEGAERSTLLSPSVKQMVIGEAKFVRAFCYYHLAGLFGDVPLVLSTGYQSSQSLPREPKAMVYSQMVADLKDAENLLLVSYPTTERARPNKMAASALLARIYLNLQDWTSAEAAATNIISSGIYSLTPNLNNVFLNNSNETIWQLKPVVPSRNTWEGFYLIPSSPTVAPTYLLTPSLMNAFEASDQRRVSWTKAHTFGGSALYYPYKYKVMSGTAVTEYYVMLRLAEQFLIRAEARAQQNNINGAKNDLNAIRSRAGLSNTTVNDKAALLLAIEQERRIELMAEWGHRWFDLKRTGRATAVLGSLKPATWRSTDELWPIPQAQLNLNPALTQNNGY